MGAEIIAQYALFGEYDFINIIKVPDDKTMARISVDQEDRGTLEFNSIRALDIDKFIDSLK